MSQSDYAFARTHNHEAVPEPCPNVMDMGGSTGENAVSCGLDCWFYCEICEVSACTKSCMKAQGCDHEVRSV